MGFFWGGGMEVMVGVGVGRARGAMEGDPVCSGSDRGGRDSSQWQPKKIFSSRNI